MEETNRRIIRNNLYIVVIWINTCAPAHFWNQNLIHPIVVLILFLHKSIVFWLWIETLYNTFSLTSNISDVSATSSCDEWKSLNLIHWSRWLMLFLTSSRNIFKQLYMPFFPSCASCISLITCFQVLYRYICVHLLFPDPRREGNLGVWPQNDIQPLLWRLREKLWTAHTLENRLLTLTLPFQKH